MAVKGNRPCPKPVKVCEFTNVVTGGTPSTRNNSYWASGDIPWLPSGVCQDCYVDSAPSFITKDGLENSAAKMMPPDTILIALTGATAGKVGHLTFPACANQSVTGILPSAKHHPRYLFHYLLNRRKKTLDDCYGGAQPHISQGYVKNIQVPLCELAEQRRIAAELDKICELKKNAETRLEKLDLLVKSRFVEMFGENQSWSKVGLLDVGECKNGVNFAPNERGYELHCIGVGNFKNFAEISNVESMPLVSLNARPSDDLLLRDGDILFVRSNGNKNLVGRCVVVHPRDTEVTFSGFCIRYRLASKRLDALYVVHYLRQSQVRRLLQGRGANIQNMSQRTLAGLSIPIPPLALQHEFAAFAEKVDKFRLNVRETVAKMDMLYRSKLQEYFG